MKNRKNVFSLFLIFSLLLFTSCTTLTGAERCALIGQIQEGTNQTTQMATGGGYGYSGIYSYPVETQNPICKIPKTEEEKISSCGFTTSRSSQKKAKGYRDLAGLWFRYCAVCAISYSFSRNGVLNDSRIFFMVDFYIESKIV